MDVKKPERSVLAECIPLDLLVKVHPTVVARVLEPKVAQGRLER